MDKCYIVVRDSDDNDKHQDISIPQCWTVCISDSGHHILQTPLSPQKASSATCQSPSPQYEWNPSTEYDNIEDMTLELAGGTVAEKVMAKQYPTLVGFHMSVAYCY